MKFITDITELEGKTIKKATEIGYDDSVALVFSDNTCAVFEVKSFGDYHEIILADDVSNEIKRDAGIITMEEYKPLNKKNWKKWQTK